MTSVRYSGGHGIGHTISQKPENSMLFRSVHSHGTHCVGCTCIWEHEARGIRDSLANPKVVPGMYRNRHWNTSSSVQYACLELWPKNARSLGSPQPSLVSKTSPSTTGLARLHSGRPLNSLHRLLLYWSYVFVSH